MTGETQNAIKSRFSAYNKSVNFRENYMKIILTLIAALSFFGLIAYSFEKPNPAREAAKISANERAENFPAKEKTPVLVELFTSEGCASCPPADKTLALLEKEQPSADAEIITLSLHVDYWNNLGWKDEFSSALFSQRQAIYGQKFRINAIYTPQMIVDGTRQFVGNNLNEAQKAISESARTPKANIELSGAADGKLKVKISEIPAHENASIYLAIAEDNLSSNVRRGENGGRTLEHASVVRELKPLGRILPPDKNFSVEITPEIQTNWKRENLKAVVFVQENQSRKILGVNRLKF